MGVISLKYAQVKASSRSTHPSLDIISSPFVLSGCVNYTAEGEMRQSDQCPIISQPTRDFPNAMLSSKLGPDPRNNIVGGNTHWGIMRTHGTLYRSLLPCNKPPTRFRALLLPYEFLTISGRLVDLASCGLFKVSTPYNGFQ